MHGYVTVFPLIETVAPIKNFDFQVLKLATESKKKDATADKLNIFMQ